MAAMVPEKPAPTMATVHSGRLADPLIRRGGLGLCSMPAVRHRMALYVNRQRKRFFFKKKKQKTFIHWSPDRRSDSNK
jgi:hypothetical protein